MPWAWCTGTKCTGVIKKGRKQKRRAVCSEIAAALALHDQPRRSSIKTELLLGNGIWDDFWCKVSFFFSFFFFAKSVSANSVDIAKGDKSVTRTKTSDAYILKRNVNSIWFPVWLATDNNFGNKVRVYISVSERQWAQILEIQASVDIIQNTENKWNGTYNTLTLDCASSYHFAWKNKSICYIADWQAVDLGLNSLCRFG